MINLEVNLADSTGATGTIAQQTPLSSLTAQSFTSLLSEAFSETLSKLGINPNAITVTVEDQPSQSNAGSQSSATTTPQSPRSTVASPVLATTLAPTPAASPAATPVATPAAASSTDSVAADESADDQYWSQQPAAVQQLRNIQNSDERTALADQLANEGYTIDVPIMVWGWDPAKVMAARQTYGYTWVPSALQQQVSAAPGVTLPGATPYNANNPPSGSILVT